MKKQKKMPRPRRFRRVRYMPEVTFFKPAGVRLAELEEVVLTVDEFEAIRLKDFLDLEQTEAAKKMNISQPTFNRLLSAARKKVAEAVVNGKSIKIEGGRYKMVVPRGRGAAGRGRGMGFGGPAEVCVCPKCGAKKPKTRGIRCVQEKCPKCGSMMVRG